MRKLAIVFILTVCANAHAAITGTVVDADAKPIAGATIRAYAAEGSDAMRARIIAGKLDREPVATAQSAENGSFSIELKTPAAVDVTIEAPAHSRTTIPTVDSDDLGVITLGPPPTRMLKVTSGGKPVANAIFISGLEVSRTNVTGEAPVALSGAATVFHPDYAVASREPPNAPEIRLTRGVAVRGRVVNGAGPVAHAIVSINGWPLAESGDDGTFSIAHASDNWRSISAVRGNEAGVATRSKTASVEIRLGAGASFAGTLRDAKRGSAVAGARMMISGSNEVSMIVLSDAKGGFTFAPLLPDDYQLSGLHPAYAIESGLVRVPATRSRAVAAQPFARARGHVLNEEKKPVANAFVSASGTGGARGRSAVTNAAGEFAVRVVPTLTYPVPLYASKRDFVTGASESRIWQPGDTRDDMVITLAHGFVARVQVVDKKDNPVPNAQVNVTRAGEGPQRSTAVACADPSIPDCHRTGADGIVAVRTIEGRHDLIVFGDDVSPARLPNQVLNARSATIVVHVDRGVEISGRVVLADGTPVAGAVVEMTTQVMPRSAVSAADGTFTMAGIASGSSVVTAVSSDGHLSATPVTVNAPARDVTLTMPRGGRIEGRVLDRATQQPVTDFSILRPSRSGRGDWDDSGQQPVHSDDGRYALDNVSPGAARLLVRASGYVAGSRSDITVEDGKTVSGIDVQLDRGAKVSGRVTSANAPVAGVQVHLAFMRMPSFNEATTDADGFYTLDGVAEGDRTIEFQKTGYVVAQKPVEIMAGKDLHLDVELDRGRELRGRVTDHSGRGLPGVYVSATVAEPRSWNPVMSDADGSFLMQGLAEGKYKVTARKDGLVSGEANDVEVPQQRPLTLTMEAGATISGRVSGIPPEQFTQVILTASGGSSRNQANADASGNFSLPGLPDGRVRVDAFLNVGVRRRMAPFKTITIENGTAPFVEMNFDDGITVNGHVTRGGVAQSMGNINFIPKTAKGSPPSPDRQSASASISGDGSYTASGLTAGDYDVRINAPGLAYSTSYTAVASGVYDIDIRGALLRGRVVDATSGAPLAETRVSVSSRAPAFGSATTDSDGRFTISALVDATYTMQVSRDQYAASTQQIVVSNGSVPDVEVRLEQAPAVTVHIVDATTGAPVDGNVMFTEAGPAHTFSGQAMRVDTGTFKVWLKPGSYNVGTNARGYIYKITPFTTPPTEVTIALMRGGRLLIRAKTAQQVRLDLPTGAMQRHLGPIHEGTNGPYEAIPPGSYLLSTYGTDRTVIRSIPVTIVAGETVTIDLP